MTLEKTKRYEWIDIWKGLLIISIVMGHAGIKYFTGTAYLFHIAAFFFVSGYLTSITKYSFGQYLKNRTRRLLIPFISANILFYLLVYVLQTLDLSAYFYTAKITASRWLALFMSDITVDLGGATWFLLILFFVSILGYGLYKATEKMDSKETLPWHFLVAATSVLIMFYALISNRIILPYNADLALGGVFYFSLGIVFKKRYGFIEENKVHLFSLIPFILFSMAAFSVFYFLGLQVDWPSRLFHGPVTDVIQSCLGIFLTGIFAILISQVKHVSLWVKETGKSSIVIILFHFLYFRIAYALLYKMGLSSSAQLKILTPATISNQLLLGFIVSFSIFMCYLTYRIFLMFGVTKELFLGVNITGRNQKSDI